MVQPVFNHLGFKKATFMSKYWKIFQKIKTSIFAMCLCVLNISCLHFVAFALMMFEKRH